MRGVREAQVELSPPIITLSRLQAAPGAGREQDASPGDVYYDTQGAKKSQFPVEKKTRVSY